jgi:hypothetical protein
MIPMPEPQHFQASAPVIPGSSQVQANQNILAETANQDESPFDPSIAASTGPRPPRYFPPIHLSQNPPPTPPKDVYELSESFRNLLQQLPHTTALLDSNVSQFGVLERGGQHHLRTASIPTVKRKKRQGIKGLFGIKTTVEEPAISTGSANFIIPPSHAVYDIAPIGSSATASNSIIPPSTGQARTPGRSQSVRNHVHNNVVAADSTSTTPLPQIEQPMSAPVRAASLKSVASRSLVHPQSEGSTSNFPGSNRNNSTLRQSMSMRSRASDREYVLPAIPVTRAPRTSGSVYDSPKRGPSSSEPSNNANDQVAPGTDIAPSLNVHPVMPDSSAPPVIPNIDTTTSFTTQTSPEPGRGASATPATILSSHPQSTDSVPPRPSETILFNHELPLAGFLNHSAHRVLYQNKTYPSALHLFEAMKFLPHYEHLADRIRLSQSPEEVYIISQSSQEHVRSDWAQVFLDKVSVILLLHTSSSKLTL